MGLLAACGAQPAPTPSPTTTTNSAVTTPTPSVPAQLVPFAATPCALLTDAQRTALGEQGFLVSAGSVRTVVYPPQCAFYDGPNAVDGSLWVATYVVTDSGLAGLVA